MSAYTSTKMISYVTPAFSVRKGLRYLPAQVVYGHDIPDTVLNYYKRQTWGISLAADIRLAKRIHDEVKKKDHILSHMGSDSGLLSIFLPQNTQNLKTRPYGMNWIKTEKHEGKKLIYIATINNLTEKNPKGIGKATVTQAIRAFELLRPKAKDNDLAINIVAAGRKQELIDLYYDYGFTVQNGGDLFMPYKNAKDFLQKYMARINKHVR